MLKLLAALFLGLIILLPPSVFSAVRPISIENDGFEFRLDGSLPVQNILLSVQGSPNRLIEVVDVHSEYLTPANPDADLEFIQIKALPQHKLIQLDHDGRGLMNVKLIRGSLTGRIQEGPLNTVITFKIKQNSAFYLLPVVLKYEL